MSDLGLVRSFSFDGKPLRFWERNGEHYVTAKDVADALGYADARKVSNLYNKRKGEFREAECCVLKVRTQRNGAGSESTDARAKSVRVFSPRGAMKIAMLAETEKAASFRDFCLDVLEKLRTGDRVLADPAKLMAEIEALKARLAASERSHVRALEIGMDSIQSLTKEAFSLIAAALAKRGALKKAERKLLGEIKSGQRFLIGGEDVAALAPRN